MPTLSLFQAIRGGSYPGSCILAIQEEEINKRWRKEGERKGEKEERIVGGENQRRRMEETHENPSGRPTVMLSPAYAHSWPPLLQLPSVAQKRLSDGGRRCPIREAPVAAASDGLTADLVLGPLACRNL